MEIRDSLPPVSEKELRAFERRHRIALPDEHRRFLLAHNGGSPTPKGFRFKHETGPYTDSQVSTFFGIGEDERLSLEHQLGVSSGRMPPNVIPIADDHFGNRVCISVSRADRGKVYFWDHEDEADPAQGERPSYSNLHLVADDFEEFLAALHDEEFQFVDAPVPVRIEGSEPAISEQKLRDFEGRIGAALPPDYRSFLLEHNGGRPEPCDFRLRDSRGQIGRFYSLGVPDPNLDLEHHYRATRGILRSDLVPVAGCVMPEKRICVSLKTGAVFRWQPEWEEDALLQVADSFEELIRSFYESRLVRPGEDPEAVRARPPEPSEVWVRGLVRVEGSFVPIGEEGITQFERKCGVRLPAAYRAFLLEHNGGHPVPKAFEVAEGTYSGSAVECFFGLGPSAPAEFDLARQYGKWKRKVPRHLLPIAIDPWKNPVCIVVSGPNTGSVCHWDHKEPHNEDDPTYHRNPGSVAASFEEFLGMLYGTAE